nr:MAG TPA: hypothetical protein [Caudoviricetes sp.]
MVIVFLRIASSTKSYIAFCYFCKNSVLSP